MDDHISPPGPQQPDGTPQGSGSLREAAREAAGELGRQVQQGLDHVRQRGPEYLDRGRQELETFGQSIERQVRRQPLASLLVAAGVGFVLGLLWRRR
jgi:ElaB/YqjD/DUF883 family membrane-anchored ribosome-binding protein